MAESRRKAESRKPAVESKDDEAEDARNTRLDRLALLLYLEGGVAIIAGMVVLSKFLSTGKVEQDVWLPAAILGAVLAVGIVFTIIARRRTAAS
jgi:hypothetical protein